MPGFSGGSSAVRQGGGFRPGAMNFSDEHLDNDAMAQAVASKSAAQSATSSAQPTTGGSALKALGDKQAEAKPTGLDKTGDKARSVGTIPQEFKRMAGDVQTELKDFVSLDRLLGINNSDTPEKQAKKKQMLSRWQKLTQSEQDVVKQKYQLKIRKEQEEEKQKQARKKQEEQAKASSVAPPSTPKKGPMGPASGMSKKAKSSAILERQMKTMSTVAGAN